ncbi:3-hydroxyisobutyryl-Coenzyme A hydrolase [Capsaspora owczarzaki ATCC 30864]|uniref:3-hydroxyisobutyryl-CoA hydrolase n=1 Tax=Capsaspora owczarzaki (strain ATCC 30864) TaxID=595528 RepID=A0A0D2WSM3_CAPO3|nr:3-hydroxyisobutyryl-Coenzyme A hydrolase [Capsaspora owczarzaki ATCC 30864]KJE95220.1 3-hydroxyisobutyryl-Coenzyme A hydrolase [Capsaspora owczarzaki ATCC 30864]|eukprot:XP_004346368.2 3-hydroxyisobutyryl-Coenzyme A hydrolase [Capsaspora owczarzaki ATCC 30864]
MVAAVSAIRRDAVAAAARRQHQHMLLSTAAAAPAIALSKAPTTQANAASTTADADTTAAAVAAGAASTEDLVLTSSVGRARVITLNRPKALNALTLDMIRSMYQVAVATHVPENTLYDMLVLRSSSPKAFCAGGDVRRIVELAKAGDVPSALAFFREEYQLDYLLSTHRLPVITFMDGITMGGGVGISVHGMFRVATENTVFSMPETPDVGGTHFLPLLDGSLGRYLALTGHRLKGADVVYAGIATHFVPSNRLDALLTRLGELRQTDPQSVDACIGEFVAPLPASTLFSTRNDVDEVFSNQSVAEIKANLEEMSKNGNAWATTTLATLAKMSPTALMLTNAQITFGHNIDTLRDALRLEYGLVQKFLTLPNNDFAEGVRAVLVDRNQPNFQKVEITSEKENELCDQYLGFTDFDEETGAIDLHNDQLWKQHNVEQLEFPIHGAERDDDFVLTVDYVLPFLFSRVAYKPLSRAAIFNQLAPALARPGNSEKIGYLIDAMCNVEVDPATGQNLHSLKNQYRLAFEGEEEDAGAQ